jgi:hypothetical protein
MLQLMLDGLFRHHLHPESYQQEIKLKTPLTRPMLAIARQNRHLGFLICSIKPIGDALMKPAENFFQES